jgi:hypothetical protein
MAALGRELVIAGRHFEVLLNAAAVLEAESEIVCTVRVALVSSAPIEECGKGQIFVSANAALQADPETILRGRIFHFSG